MTEVMFKHYRDYIQQRIVVNDAVMGLLAGSKLSEQMLSLSEGSKRRLMDIYPAIPHIERFNLPVAKARTVLDDAENLLVALAVPQILALHESLMVDMLSLLNIGSSRLQPSNMHEIFEDETGLKFLPEELEMFHLIRLVRNMHIHNAGRAKSNLVEQREKLSSDAARNWEDTTGEFFPTYKVGELVTLSVAFLVGTLAITKRLATMANEHLQQVVPTSGWAELVSQEWKQEWKNGNKIQQLQRFRGIARHFYSVVKIPNQELEAAFESAFKSMQGTP